MLEAPLDFPVSEQDTTVRTLFNPPAIERVVRQLLEALMFEQCIDYIVVNREKFGHIFYFSLGKRDFACGGRLRGFDRLRLNMEELVELDGGKKRRVALAEMLMWTLRAIPGDKIAKNRLLDEVLQTIFWLDWNRRNLAAVPVHQHLPYTALETALRDGHPYHPCFKTCTGFTAEDHARYSYECGEPFQVHWLAVSKSMVRFRACDGTEKALSLETFIIQQVPPEVLQAMHSHSIGIEDFIPVPAHPWQWRNVLASAVVDDGASVISLGEVGDFYLPSQSQRTLMNVSRPGSPDIKLPLNIVCTSSNRNLLTHGVCSAPVVSRWLYDCVAGDSFFRDHPLTILREFAGIRVEPSIYAAADPAVSLFSAIWRESVTSNLRAGEQAVPATAILAEEAGHPFIQQWVELYGLSTWLKQFFRVLVLPVWHLLMRHGIAVEAHAQNSILIHRDGWPVRLALRDFHESIEYAEDFIADPTSVPDFVALDEIYRQTQPNQYYWMESVEALRELVMDTLFVFHLSDVADICHRHYGFGEVEFWGMLQTLLTEYERAGYCDANRLQKIHYRSPLIQTESLVRRKLWDTPTEELRHLVKNPFSGAG